MAYRIRLLILLLLSLTVPAWAEDAPAAESASAPAINPQVIDKLIQLGEHLRSLPRFKVGAEMTQDVVLESGQKIKTNGSTELVVDGHSKLYAKLSTDSQERVFYYNGKQFTLYAPFLKYYTTIAAPATLSETLHQFETYYQLRLPLEDLFLLGRDQAQIDGLTGAAYVGPSTIKGKLCDHLAFRQPGMDWQLWVTRSDKPLPCKLVITSSGDAGAPEYTAIYSWELKPSTKASQFTFKPAKDDLAIPMKKLAE
jgi:hypothetical protein